LMGRFFQNFKKILKKTRKRTTIQGFADHSGASKEARRKSRLERDL
jgi:hypothetical protein